LNSAARDFVQVPVSPLHKETALTITVVICSRNRPALLGKCLEGVAALMPPPDEVLVVDNSDGNKETETMARKYSARYTVEATPGLSRARNRGMAESNTDIVAYVDDDATPDVHWLRFLLEPFADPQVASVSGTIIFLGSNAGDARESYRTLSNEDSQWFEIATFGGLGWGSNMAFRKAACAGRTVFDLRLGRGAPIEIAEENHAFASLLLRGYRAVYVPDAIVIHPFTNGNIEDRATRSVAYWLLLFADFPGHRLDLLRFLSRRLRRKPLTWPRNPQIPGELITSGWRVYLRAGFRGTLLFLRAKRLPKA
jgi:cellulose synthase/poly-beta-1,6-N-acetylglucosamine synthase-like glycosyltransferase